jgi:hypothetical protein
MKLRRAWLHHVIPLSPPSANPWKGTGARSRAAILCIILSHKAESAICNNSTVSATNKVQFRQESRSLEADL